MLDEVSETEASTSAAPQARAATLARVLTLWPYALVLAAGIFVLVPALGSFGFWDPWEPKYAESAREMIELDSYVTPYYRYDVRLTKPILVYWGILAGSAIFGLNEFGARIGGVSLSLLSMLGMYYAVSRVRGTRAGLITALVLGTLPHFYFISRQAMPDVYLFTSLGSALLFFALGLAGPERRRNLHFGISYAAFALAVLAKGPMIAGAVGGVTLAVYAATRIDQQALWQAGMRIETIRFAVALVTGSILLTGFFFCAFFFGTDSEWWGYSSDQRESADDLRVRLLAETDALHVSIALLVLIALGALATAVFLNTRRALPGWRRHGGVVACSIGSAAALAALFFAGQETRLLVAGLLGTVACAWFLIASLLRLLTRPEIADRVQPLVRPILYQLGLFAVVFLAVAGPWHVAIVLEQGHGYFSDFIIKHNVNRAVEKVNSSGVTDFYLRTLIFGYFPWCAFIPLAVTSLVSWWDPKLFRRYGFEAFLLIAAAVTFTAFSLSTTKFPHYLAPMLIPMAALIGLTISRSLDLPSAPASRLTWIVASMFYLLPMLDLIREDGVRYIVGSFTVKRWVPDELQTGGYSLVLLGAAAGLMLLSILVRSRLVVGGLLVVALLLANYYATSFIPALSPHKTLAEVVRGWKTYGTPDDPIGFHGDLKHGIFFYTGHEVELLKSHKEFMEFMNPSQRAFAVVELTRLFKIRGPYEKQFPGHRLHVVEDSHFTYKLVANYPAAGEEPARGSDESE